MYLKRKPLRETTCNPSSALHGPFTISSRVSEGRGVARQECWADVNRMEKANKDGGESPGGEGKSRREERLPGSFVPVRLFQGPLNWISKSGGV